MKNSDTDKSKAELIQELEELRRQVTELTRDRISTESAGKGIHLEPLFSIFNDAPYGVVIIGQEKTIFVNSEATQITGYSRVDVPTVTACFQKLFPDPAYQKKVWAFWEQDIARKGNKAKREFFATCQDGSVKALEFKVNVVAPDTILVIFSDVTRRREKIQALAESEMRYRTIFETTGTATIIVEADKTISLVNQGFTALSGYPREEVEGKLKWTHFVLKDDLKIMEKFHRLRRIKTDVAPRNYEFRFVDRYKNIKNIYLTIDIIPHTKRSVASLLDITERKQIEQEREKLIQDLQHALAEIKTLSGLLPICAYCKKVRDDQGYWKQVEAYIEEHSTIEFTHSICPDCAMEISNNYKIDDDESGNLK